MDAIFNRLLNARSNSNEDFVTVMFSGLLEVWNKVDNVGFKRFIKWLAGMEPATDLVIIDCFRPIGKYGKPDLYLQFKDILVLIENKWDAEPDPEQIKRYALYLEKYKNEYPLINTRLIFINPIKHYTKWVLAPDMDITWIDIAEKIREMILDNAPLNVETRYKELYFFAEQFYKFMEENNMTEKPIKWQYLEGAHELVRLLHMIEDIVKELKEEKCIELKKSPQSALGIFWAGVNFNGIDDLKFWVGQRFNDKDEHGLRGLQFSVMVSNSKSELIKKLEKEDFKETDKNWWTKYFAFGADNYFFSKDFVDQKDVLKKFIKESINKVYK